MIIRGKAKISIAWDDDDTLSITVLGPTGKLRGHFNISLRELLDEMDKKGVWHALGIPVKTSPAPGAERGGDTDGK